MQTLANMALQRAQAGVERTNQPWNQRGSLLQYRADQSAARQQLQRAQNPSLQGSNADYAAGQLNPNQRRMQNGQRQIWNRGVQTSPGGKGESATYDTRNAGGWKEPSEAGMAQKLFQAGVTGIVGGGVLGAGSAALGGTLGAAPAATSFGGVGVGGAGAPASNPGFWNSVGANLKSIPGQFGTRIKTMSDVEKAYAALSVPTLIGGGQEEEEQQQQPYRRSY
jgi:hypothetical protein